MKPPPFSYHAPATVAEALDVLARVGEDGKVLAGGQSLIPILNMRLAAPADMVDVNGVAGLGGIEVADGAVVVGATVRQAELERDDAAAAASPLLREGLRLVAHPVIRNRGTVCGSLAHADPAAELPAVLALLGGTVRVASASDPDGRDVAASDFFAGPLTAALRPDELVVSASFPVTGPATGVAVAEVARRHGDYALAGVAAAVDVDGHTVTAARGAYFSVADTPLVVDLGEAVAGAPVDRADWAAAGRLARDAVDPDDDLHATGSYRRHLCGVLTGRVLRRAAARATGAGDPPAAAPSGDSPAAAPSGAARGGGGPG